MTQPPLIPVLTEAHFSAWNDLKTPIWIFDLQNLQMWWANQTALVFWQANTLEELLNRNWKNISASTRARLNHYLSIFEQGESISEQWTFYPKGKPVSMGCTCSAIRLPNGDLGLLFEGEPLNRLEAIPAQNLRALEAFRHSSALISLYDLQGNLVQQNPTAFQYYGEEKTLRDRFVKPFSFLRLIEALERDKRYQIEAEIKINQGSRWHYLDFSYTNDPITGENLILLTETDISDRKLLQNQYQQTAEQLEAVLNAIPGFVSWIDNQCRYLGVNDCLAQTFNRRKEEFIGQTPGSITGNWELMASLERFFKSNQQSIKQEITAEIGGKTNYYLLITQKYLQGEVAVTVGIDVTKRKEIQEKLKQNLEQSLRFKKITNQIHSCLELTEICETASWEIGEAFGVSRCLIFSYDSKLRALVLCAEYVAKDQESVAQKYLTVSVENNSRLKEVLKSDRALYFPDRVPDSVLDSQQDSDTVFSELAVGTSYHNKPNGLIVLQDCNHQIWQQKDISFLEEIATQLGIAIAHAELLEEEKQQRKALLKAKLEAEAANQGKSEFLAMMSHEIRTPLNSVLGMTDLLLENDPNPQNQDFLKTIRASGDNLLTIINDLLEFSKLEAGHLTLNYESLDLRSCLEEVLGMLRANALSKGLNLAYQIFPETPTQIQADGSRLRQVLINLLGNAIKFTEAGEVVLSVSNIAYGKRVKLLFTVTDTGIGISKKQRDRLFQPFSQGDASTTRRYGGTGLGLVISKRLIESMGGKIWLESEVGKGTTFFFTVTTKITSENSEKNWYQEQSCFAGKQLLIVCQNPTNRAIIEQYAASWGMKVYQTDNWQDIKHEPSEKIAFDVGIFDQPNNSLAIPSIILETQQGRVSSGETSLLIPIKPVALDRCLRVALNLSSPSSQVQSNSDQPLTIPKNLSILLVEDNRVNQKVAKQMLKRLGYENISLANNGKEALFAFEKSLYDLVLMDVQMPEMDGLEATRQIRRQSEMKQPWIIAMTANAMAGDREMCLEAGMNDYLSKPLRLQAIQDAIAKLKEN